MPLQKLQFRPGVNREGTTLSNEGGWDETEKVRFRSGYPEKIGGWQLDSGTAYPSCPTGTFTSGGTSTVATNTTGAFWGIAKAIWNWLNLSGYNLVSIGTNLKYYIQNSSGGSFNDITPIRTTSTTLGTAVTFAATNGSTTITVTNNGHGCQTGDFVAFSGAASLGGAITALVLNREYQVTYLTSNTYSITSSATAGAFVVGVTYVIESVGTTNFVAIGAASNTVGVVFTATGVGSGTGSASPRANASDSGTGGGATVASYQITSGSAGFTFGTGWGAGGFGGFTIGVGSTTISAGINSSVTSIALTSVAGFTATGVVLIDSEQISYTGISTLTLTGCTRGANGSTAASHSSGAAAQLVTGWGSPAPAGLGLGIQLRLWSQSNYGEDLIFNPRGGAMYYWANNINPNTYDRGQIIKASTNIVTKAGTYTPDSTCPSVANFVMVSDASRFVFAFGTNDPTGVYSTIVQDPMQIRWSDQNAFSPSVGTTIVWTPSITNQAGGIRLSHGSTIVAAIQTRQEILVLTDSAVYSMQYLGAPYVWSTQLLGDNISIASPNAMATVNNVTYWMGTDKFYMYSGRVETLPCALRSYIYNDINLSQAFQFFAGTNEGFNEIWWFYCSANSQTIDKYVIYNHLERTWYHGSLARSAWLDSPIRAEPMAAGYANTNGRLIYQETGVDDNETGTPLPIECYVQSSDFDIGDGHNFGFVWRLIPDITFDGSFVNEPSADFTVRPRQNPGANYGATDSPTVTSTQNYAGQRTYNVQQFTEQVYVRIRGRQMAFRISSNDLGVQWQLGVPRIDVRPDGRR